MSYFSFLNSGRNAASTRTGVIQSGRDSSGNALVRVGGRDVRARILGPMPGVFSRVVLLNSGGEQFIVGADDLRKQLTREYIVNG